MCYITLYLVLEHSIVPELEVKYSEWVPRRIAKRKYAYFHYLLSEIEFEETDLDATEHGAKSKFATNIGFGKLFLKLLQEFGVAALLMLAVCDIGITVVARALGSEGKNHDMVRSAHCCSRGWWCFAHALGPPTFKTLFGHREIRYTATQLLWRLWAEPLPSSTMALINRSCEGIEITLPADLELVNEDLHPIEWVLKVGNKSLAISHHPTPIPGGRLHGQQTEKHNVWKWLQTSSLVPKGVFDFLYPGAGNHVDSEEAVNFFCKFYNHRAIIGRRAIPTAAFVTLTGPHWESLNQKDRLDILSNGSQCELLVFPTCIDAVVLGIALYPQKGVALVYNWTPLQELSIKVTEVGTLL